MLSLALVLTGVLGSSRIERIERILEDLEAMDEAAGFGAQEEFYPDSRTVPFNIYNIPGATHAEVPEYPPTFSFGSSSNPTSFGLENGMVYANTTKTNRGLMCNDEQMGVGAAHAICKAMGGTNVQDFYIVELSELPASTKTLGFTISCGFSVTNVANCQFQPVTCSRETSVAHHLTCQGIYVQYGERSVASERLEDAQNQGLLPNARLNENDRHGMYMDTDSCSNRCSSYASNVMHKICMESCQEANPGILPDVDRNEAADGLPFTHLTPGSDNGTPPPMRPVGST